jgi:hypothetical protein
MAQVVDYLPRKHEALVSISSMKEREREPYAQKVKFLEERGFHLLEAHVQISSNFCSMENPFPILSTCPLPQLT